MESNIVGKKKLGTFVDLVALAKVLAGLSEAEGDKAVHLVQRLLADGQIK